MEELRGVPEAVSKQLTSTFPKQCVTRLSVVMMSGSTGVAIKLYSMCCLRCLTVLGTLHEQHPVQRTRPVHSCELPLNS